MTGNLSRRELDSKESYDSKLVSKPDPEAVLDTAVFFGSSGLLLIITAGFMMRPESSALLLDELYVFVTSRIGVVYIFAAIFTLGFLFWLACSSYGSMVLGAVNKPHYSTLKWASMLFCSGIGGSLIYWGGTEWVFYYVDPPFGLPPLSDESLE